MVVPGKYRVLPKLANPPRISIVTPSYNQAAFLEQTIKSVLDQGYPNLEYVVQDGGSKDGSREVLERYSAEFSHWESAPDGGQTNAINLGFRHTTGEIMAYLNSDDLLLTGTLHYVADYFAKHPDVDVIYGHRINIDEVGLEVGRWVMPPHDGAVLSWADFIPQETLFWRRRIWDRIGGSLDESFHFAMDWDLLLRFRDAGAKFVRLPRFLAAFRVHPQQKTMAEIGDVGFKEMARLRERCHGRQVSPAEIKLGVASYLMRHVVWDKIQRLFP
ncbi:MAG: glycosyltransferase [Betaproteobacteria bacterium]|nr:glycosyltransferase [Betaproteobacteria bacterium]